MKELLNIALVAHDSRKSELLDFLLNACIYKRKQVRTS